LTRRGVAVVFDEKQEQEDEVGFEIKEDSDDEDEDQEMAKESGIWKRRSPRRERSQRRRVGKENSKSYCTAQRFPEDRKNAQDCK
jgi:hypothetical protein